MSNRAETRGAITPDLGNPEQSRGNLEQSREVAFNKLQADFQRLYGELATLRQHLSEVGAEGARSVRELGATQLDLVRRELDELSRNLQRQGRDALVRAEQAVQERPLTSLLLAFGAGMILTRLFGRRG